MFETERLMIRRMDDRDLDDIFAMRSDADVMQYIRAPQNRLEAANWIKLVSSRWEPHGLGFCSVIEKTTNQFVGWCGLWRLSETNEVEVGYAIAKNQWFKGFASEAARRFLEYGFNELELDEIVAVAREENLGSRRVMEKLGMQFDYIGRFYEAELVHYSITRKEFLSDDRN